MLFFLAAAVTRWLFCALLTAALETLVEHLLVAQLTQSPPRGSTAAGTPIRAPFSYLVSRREGGKGARDR